ncbi:MAG TPA: ATP-binding protein [Bryobacteraceae bacterium]|nr:ATP-binding protein [Bryobacteraceae bacterium]
MSRRPITHANIFRVLIAGFMLVILLLVAAAIVSVQSLRLIHQNVADIVGEELVANRLIDDIQHEQAALSAVFLKLSRDPEVVDREKVLADLDDAERRMDQIDETVAGSPEEPLWNELEEVTAAFADEARRLLSVEKPTTLLSRDLFRRNQEALSLVAKLAALADENTAKARHQIETRSSELMRNTFLLLGTCILLAMVCAFLTVRMVLGLFRRMERQASEYSRVSWHMLENQETTARRFSHELHDELGQSLTAVKANLHALELDGAARPAGDAEGHRIADCVELVNEAIRNVRELSQLLHPTILDDFGLDAAIRWLAERFTQRTGIEVEYEPEFHGRLNDEAETHLYRISQEALTNVARHSGAKHVHIELRERGANVELIISDDGHGLPSGAPEEQGMGLVGMRARASSAGGELSLHSVKGKGLRIEARLPARKAEDAEKDPHPVGG